MNKVAVVIPSHKAKLSNNEKISLTQCRKVLKKYDRFLVVPEGTTIDYADDEKLLPVRAEYLSSRKAYSEYVLSEEFYQLFEDYEYILIYQLDAFVFEDKLEYFCNLGYDYIGAEWLHGLECHTMEKSLWYFANGGFSLRKVSAFLRWIRECKATVDYGKMLVPEDMAIAVFGSEYLKIAKRPDSMDFAYEMHPEECHKLHGGQLPFGCHAWHRFGRYFWKEIIDSYGYDVEIIPENQETIILSSGPERFEKLKKYFSKEKLYKTLLRMLPNWDGKIYVFGAGHYGFSFANMALGTEIEIVNIIDNDNNKIGKKINDIEIISLMDALDKESHPILVALANPQSVEELLLSEGLVRGKDFVLSADLQKEMCNER